MPGSFVGRKGSTWHGAAGKDDSVLWAAAVAIPRDLIASSTLADGGERLDLGSEHRELRLNITVSFLQPDKRKPFHIQMIPNPGN